MNSIESFTKQFTKETIEPVIQVQRNFFTASPSVLAIKNKIKAEPFALGTYLGCGKPFHPSVALLDWLNDRTERYVVIDKKAAWLFVCGRDVFSNAIINQKDFVSSGPVLVKNEQNELLGYGELTPTKKIALKHIMDRGDFLRRERH